MSLLRDRFHKEMDKKVEEYTASIPFDWHLYSYDIQGSIAHARMLGKQGIIPADEAEIIIDGLAAIEQEIEEGSFDFKKELEDIHLNIESRLFEKIGDVAGKLHTARSRNDQIALDMRLYTKDAIEETIEEVTEFQRSILTLAESNKDVVIPGYTHLQRAQPVLLAHHLLAYFEMLSRDKARFNDALARADVMPLGSGALAGVPYDIDRPAVAAELGFSRISTNSMDAVSDRDFIVEYMAAASLAMMHMSRLAEELVLWSSAEFGFIEIDDGYATGSSIMPQKKNPDVAELARGKTGRVYGHLVGMLTMLKSLPLAYNKDLQEDKEGFFDTVSTVLSTLDVFTGMISTLTINKEKARSAAEGNYSLATDLADYLVKKGSPFRQAHQAVSRLVQYAVEQRKSLRELSIEEYKTFSTLFTEDVYDISVESSVNARNVPGGTATTQVVQALAKAKESIDGENKRNG